MIKILLPLLAFATTALVAAPPEFKLVDGDRVALVGGGFVEREGKYGHIETAITTNWADANLSFRNFGWSGDTVFGHARSYFGPPVEGFERLRNHLEMVKPTVIMSVYGSVASFEGEGGLEKFSDGYKKLIAMMQEAAPKARLVLVSPPPFESKGAPLPDMTARNEMLGLYRDRIREIADEAEVSFVDVFAAIGDAKGLTSDGVHYTPDGYAAIAEKVVVAMGGEAKDVLTDQLDTLRKVVVEKNRLFFYRWRPQNETYLHGFRKHEQGNNAKELAEFEPMVAEKEKEIAKLRKELSK